MSEVTRIPFTIEQGDPHALVGTGPYEPPAERPSTIIGPYKRLVRGDLDWLVLKCLEKDRTRRYETANELARDVDRYLKFEWRYWDRLLHQERYSALLTNGTLSGDMTRVVTRSSGRWWDSGLKVVDAASGNEPFTLSDRKCHLGTYLPNYNGTRLALVRTDPNENPADQKYGPRPWVEVWGVAGDGKKPLFIQEADSGTFLGLLAFSPDGKRLATVERMGDGRNWDVKLTVKVWNLNGIAGKPALATDVSDFGRDADFGSGSAPGRSVTVSPSGRFVLSVNVLGRTEIWETDSGKVRRSFLVRPAVNLIKVSSDGRLLTFADETGVAVLDFDTPDEPFPVARKFTVYISHDSRRLLTIHQAQGNGGIRREIKVWDVETGRPFSLHDLNDTMIATSRDGQCYLATKQGEDKVALVDAGTGLTSFTLEGKDVFDDFRMTEFQYPGRPSDSLLFSPDRTMLVTEMAREGDAVLQCRVWDLVNHRELFRIERTQLARLAFTPDGKRLAGYTEHLDPSGWRNAIKLWDCATGNELLHIEVPRAEGDPVDVPPRSKLAFTPDGHRLAWTFRMKRDYLTRTWDATPRAEAKRP